MSKFSSYFSHLIRKPQGTTHSKDWQLNLLWTLRVITLLSALRQIFFGEMSIGIITLICLFLITIPALVTMGKVKNLPFELETLFLTMVLLQFIIGEARDFYTNVPYYDKFVHFFLPLMLGFMGFLFVYLMFYTNRLSTSVAVMFIVTFLIAMGIGALWEVVEYLSDELIYPRVEGWHHFQGSLTEDALHDTMNDLIADMLGALVGATLAVYYFKNVTKQTENRTSEMLDEISEQLFE